MFFLVVHLHRDVFVAAFVARRKALVHGLGINKEFKGGTRLAHGFYLVVFPRVEVDVAHPCFHSSRLWFHCHKAAVHEPNHIADGVHRRDIHLDRALGIVEKFNLMGLIEIVRDGVGLVGEFLQQPIIHGLFACDALDEVGYHPSALVNPRVVLSPMVLEVLLNLPHLFGGGIFGVFLHTRVEGGINL